MKLASIDRKVTVYDSYVAIGDSFTEGLEDVGPYGEYRGWADLLARQLAARNPRFRYANLAIRGRRLAQVAAQQAPTAVRMNPSLITLAAGGNDVIRLHCDVHALGRLLRRTLGRLSATGATVVVFAGFDPTLRIPLSRLPADRARAYNEYVRASAREYDAILIDMWRMPGLYDDIMWAPDRLHLSSHGHVLVAQHVMNALGIEGTLPDPGEPRATPVGFTHDLRWTFEHFAPWVLRHARGISSGDGIVPKRPALLPLDQ